MAKLNSFFSLAALGVGLLSPFFARAQTGVAGAIHVLCQSGQTEGLYNVQFGHSGRVALYIVCLGADELAVTWRLPNDPESSITLLHAALDGDQFTFTSFELGDGEAKGISAHPVPAIRLEVSFTQLTRGVFAGRYKTMQTRIPTHVSGARATGFPNLLSEINRAHDNLSFIGTYRLDKGVLGGVTMKYPIYFDLDVINGIQRIAVTDSGQIDFALFDGMPALGSGNTLYANSGLAGKDGSVMPLLQVRGQLTQDGKFVFYYFNTMYGMNGPLTAQRLAGS